jgi:amidase
VEVTGTRIGWLGDWGGAYPTEPGILEVCRGALRSLEEIGCVVEEVAPPFPAEELWEAWITLRSWSVAAGLAAVFDDPASRALLKPEALWENGRGQVMSAMEVHRASVIRSRWHAVLAGLFQRFDALVLPAAQVWPFPKEWRYPQEIAGRAMDTYHRWMEVVIPVSLVGVPALAMPAGFGGPGSGGAGLPMGVQVFGPKGSDRQLLRLGQAYHRATDWPGRCPPVLA